MPSTAHRSLLLGQVPMPASSGTSALEPVTISSPEPEVVEEDSPAEYLEEDEQVSQFESLS